MMASTLFGDEVLDLAQLGGGVLLRGDDRELEPPSSSAFAGRGVGDGLQELVEDREREPDLDGVLRSHAASGEAHEQGHPHATFRVPAWHDSVACVLSSSVGPKARATLPALTAPDHGTTSAADNVCRRPHDVR